MKKLTFFTIFLSFISLVAFAQSTTLSGSGTVSDPYLIQSIDDLKFFRDETNKNEASLFQGNDLYFELTTNLNLENENWTPIGVGGSPYDNFRGYFDGKGHKIKNLKVGLPTDSANIQNAGLFGVTRRAVIRNLILDNAAVYQATTVDELDLRGSLLIANADTTTVENCHVSGTLMAYNNTTLVRGFFLGGILGWCRDINVINCSANVNIVGQVTTGTSIKPANIGALVGMVRPNISGSSNVLNCFTTGSILIVTSGASGLGIAGGVVGNFQGPNAEGKKSSIVNCYTTVKTKIVTTAASSTIDLAMAGIIGSHGTGNTASNCIAKNDSIITQTSSVRNRWIYRIKGNGFGTTNNNYADEQLSIIHNNVAVSISNTGLNTLHGADLAGNIPMSLLNTYCSANAAPSGYSWNGWVNVNISSADSQKGTVQGGGLCFNNVNSTIIATPKAGFKFSGWKENGAVVSTDAVYSFVPGNTERNLSAEFESDVSTTFNILESRFVELKGKKLFIKNQNVYLSIIDIAGKQIFTGKPNGDIVFEKQGVYIVKVRIDDFVECYKIMINNY